MDSYKSEEARFLELLIKEHGLEKGSHPIFTILLQQLTKMPTLIDKSEANQKKVREILDSIREGW